MIGRLLQLASLLASIASSALAADPCDVQAQMLVETVPGIAAQTGIRSGPELSASQTRLLLVSSIFVFSSCQLSEPANCDVSPPAPREYWLNTLLLSGLLMGCFESDSEGFAEDQLSSWRNIESVMPAEHRNRLIAQANIELGGVLEVAE